MPQIILLDSFEAWDTTDPLIKWDTISNYNSITLGAQYGRNGGGARVRSGGTSTFDALGQTTAGGNSSAMLEKYFSQSPTVDVGLALKLVDQELFANLPIVSFLDTTLVLDFLGNYFGSHLSLVLTPQQQLAFGLGNFFNSSFSIVNGSVSPPLKRGVFSYLQSRVSLGVNGTARLVMDGKVVIEEQIDTTATSGNLSIGGVRLFNHKSAIGAGGNARTYQVDDVYIAIDGPLGFRDGLIEHSVPISDGERDEWIPSNGQTFNYDMVNELSADEDTTYNAASASGKTDTYNVTPLVHSGSVFGVALNVCVVNKDFDEATLSAVVRQEGIDYVSDPQRVGTITAKNPHGYKYNIYGYNVNPATGLQFTLDELHNDQFGMQLVQVESGGGGGPPPPPPPPAAPSGLSATATSDTQINLTWVDNSSDETAFRVVRSSSGAGGPFIQVISVGPNVTSALDVSLTPNTTYHYKAQAANLGGYSDFSNVANATTNASPPATPNAPTSLSATAASSSQINLTWTDNASNETGYKIERSPTGVAGTFVQIATVGVNVSSFSNVGLSASTIYYYRVRATNSAGDSAYSNTANATTSAAPPPPPPPPPPPAADYYVSTLGSDGNPGTITQPFRTIAKGLSVLSAGKTLHIRAGTYAERINSNTQTIPTGTSWSNAPRIMAYPGETVTLRPGSGSEVINLAHSYIQYVIFDRLVIDGVGTGAAVSFTNGAHHVRMQNGEVKNSNGSGIIASYGSAVSPNRVYNEFINLKVYNNGTVANLDHGFYFAGSSNLIERCEIYNNAAYGITFYSGMDSRPPTDNIIRYNRIRNNNRLGSGRGGISAAGNNNLIYNNILSTNSEGIEIGYGLSSGNKVYHNTIYNHSNFGIQVRASDVSNTEIKNNIVYSNGSAIINNGIGTAQSNNLTTNPSFVNAAGGDFHLQSGSAAINAGVTLSEVPDDYEGNLRPQGSAYDIGAYERLS